jgi:hypothetical protein
MAANVFQKFCMLPKTDISMRHDLVGFRLFFNYWSSLDVCSAIDITN